MPHITHKKNVWLNLAYRSIIDEDCELVLDRIQKEDIHILCFRGSHITARGGTSISEYLKMNESVTEVNLDQRG